MTISVLIGGMSGFSPQTRIFRSSDSIRSHSASELLLTQKTKLPFQGLASPPPQAKLVEPPPLARCAVYAGLSRKPDMPLNNKLSLSQSALFTLWRCEAPVLTAGRAERNSMLAARMGFLVSQLYSMPIKSNSTHFGASL